MKSSVRIHPQVSLVTTSLVLSLLVAVQSAPATVQYWDPGLTPTANSNQGSGGDGTWATATANWVNGTSDVAWTEPSNINVASFSGSAGTVIMGTPTTVRTTGGVQFNTSNYVLGDVTAGQLAISTQASADGIIVASGVTGITANLSSIKLGSLGSGTNIALTNTDKIDFKNTTIYLSGNRTTNLVNSSASATTTFASFGASDKPNGGTGVLGALNINQGNLVINSLGAAANANGTLSAFNDTTTPTPRTTTLTIAGSSTGTVTINGNNTLFNNGTGSTATGLVGLKFNMVNGTLLLGHDNALGALNANSAASTTTFEMASGTVAASGGARIIANVVTVSGNAAIGGSNNFTLSGNVTVNATKTLTISNTAVTMLSGTNTNSGTIAVSPGSTLLVNGITTGGAYTIASGATFGGTGTVDLSVANGSVTLGNGSLLQATSADTLTFNLGTGVLNVSGALANASPSMVFTLGAPGSVVVSATSTNIGSGVLEFGDFNFTAGTGFGAGTYTLFTSFVGTMGVNLTGTVGGLDAAISQSGNDIILTTVSAVPEPSTFAALAGVGVLGAALLHRRRRS